MGTQSNYISKRSSGIIKFSNLTTDTNDLELDITFNKICIAQNLLKEMYSLKERFEENQNKMIGQIEQNCIKFFKNKLHSKEIYDYFESNNLEKRIEYKLITCNSKNNLDKNNNINEDIYNFLFILRNNNSLILDLIDKCDEKYYKDLSHFLTHYFFEDISNCSFFQDELLLIIYLFLEKLIMNTLPDKLKNSNLKKDGDLYNNKINKHFIYYLFNDLTKKPDIRSFFCSLLSDSIIRLEENTDNLSIETKKKAKKKDLNEENKKQNNNNNNKNDNKNIQQVKSIKLKKNKSKENLFNSKEETFLKDNKKIKESIRQSINKITKRLSVVECATFQGINDINKNVDFEKIIKDMASKENVKIDPFFDKEDIDINYLCEKLSFYHNIKEKTEKDYAMIEYLDIILSEITKDGEPVEIFSTIILKNELKLLKMKNDSDYTQLVNTIKTNYDYIISFISTLIIKIKENINMIPYSLKCIFKILEELLNKKFINQKKEIYSYLLFMTKTRIFFGCMIIPILSNPDYSGIFTDGIISNLTKDNINIIVKIFKTLVSGSLFLVESQSYTIFNKYIIELAPNVFDIIMNLDTNCILPDFISKLMDDIPMNIDDKNRMINFDYFKERKDEKIQLQSICFSWKILDILTNTIKKNNNLFINNLKNEEEVSLFNKIMNNRKNYVEMFQDNSNNKSINYYLYTKILYENIFDTRINAILKDNFEILFQGKENDEILMFKKCLSEVLAYVNYLQKEDFIFFLRSSEKIEISKNTDIIKYNNNKKKILFDNIPFETKKSEKKQNVKNQNDLLTIKHNLKKVGFADNIEISNNPFFLRRQRVFTKLSQMKEDLDFKNIIFPQMISKALSEIYYNPNKGKSERIIFCISFTQEHIDKLPVKYTRDNFKLIFDDILEQPEILIKELQYNILNQFYLKIRNCEKLNVITSKHYFQINNMERFLYTRFLFNKIIIKGTLNIKKTNDHINNLELNLTSDKNNQTNIDTIQSFIKIFPNFKQYELQENILELEKKLKIDEIINNYFKELKNVVKNEKILSNFSPEEFLTIIYELENYILLQLYNKLYPSNQSNEDIFLYKKCCRLNFVKPENIIKNKKMINEKLLDISINYINDMDKKFTPVDKIKNFGKALDILKNSMTFNSGKTDLGLDDTLPFIIYIVLKSKQKNLCTNLNYCNLFINPDLNKKQFGNMLTQLGMVINIIKNMKYNELIDVTEEQFGKDE